MSEGLPRKLVEPETIERLIRLRQSRYSIEQISEITGVTKSAVHRHVRHIPVDNRGAANAKRRAPPPAWLPRAQQLLTKGMTRLAVAQKLGVHPSVFYRALERFG